MRTYLNNLISEKNINSEMILEIEGSEWGTNFIPLKVVIDFLLNADKATQEKAKMNLIKIDFHNGDVLHFFKYIAKFLAK